MRFSTSRILGTYLAVISTLQFILYVYLYFGKAGYKDWLDYQVVDPRTFWTMIEQVAGDSDPTQFTFIGFLSALWVLAIGLSFVFGRLPFKTFICSELILGLPQLLLVLPWGLLMVSEGEGIFTSVIPALLVFFFTVVPVPWAIYLAIYGKSENAQ